MKVIIATVLFSTFTLWASAQTTFTKDVAEIIYNKCATCHRPGEIGPFSLTNYNEVKAYAPTIKYVTTTRYMPPWKANPDYQHYLDENFLTQEEIAAIAAWVDNGSPYGNAAEEPSLPDFPEGSAIGTPDLVLTFAEAHVHKGNNKDEYRYFVLPTGLTEDKVIKAIEMRPGNSKIVHHALFFQDKTGRAASFDAKTPEYGFLGTSGFDNDAVLFYDQYPGYVPGQRSRYFPDGLGQIMNAGSDLVIQMHYAPTSVDEIDSSTVNIFFADENEPIDRLIDDDIMLPSNLPGGFFGFNIPANQTKKFEGTWTLTQDRSFMGIFPHMHLLGTEWEVWLERPDGSKENLIQIPDWDFNWQGGYYFTKFIVAPKGSKVRANAVYDNTASNPNNPSNPPRFVSWGENTTDEMYYLPILSVPYKDGDENVIFDESTDVSEIELGREANKVLIFPNPSTGELVNVSFELSSMSKTDIALYNSNGKLIRLIREGEFFPRGKNFVHINTAALPIGQYLVKIKTNSTTQEAKLLVVR